MLVVVALGGNALLRRGEPMDAESLRRNVENAARIVAELAGSHDVVVTHGNGPQVGLLALQSEALEEVPPYPLDVLGAESEGMIGYLIARELRRFIPGREVATLLTQVEVDPMDAAFENPTKPIGPSYSSARASKFAQTRGWTMTEESKGGFRRVVPSPEPTEIVELNVIRLLVSAGVLVTCVGGGGIPVARSSDGSLQGVEAVIDKDLASALLATQLGADLLLLLTDQPAVFADWPHASNPIGATTVQDLRAMSFEHGTMGPKVEAACRFAAATRNAAAIGALEDATKIVKGTAGTRVSFNEPE